MPTRHTLGWRSPKKTQAICSAPASPPCRAPQRDDAVRNLQAICPAIGPSMQRLPRLSKKSPTHCTGTPFKAPSTCRRRLMPNRVPVDMKHAKIAISGLLDDVTQGFEPTEGGLGPRPPPRRLSSYVRRPVSDGPAVAHRSPHSGCTILLMFMAPCMGWSTIGLKARHRRCP